MRTRIAVVFIMLFSLSLSHQSSAESAEGDSNGKTISKDTETLAFEYKPPKRGAPVARVGGGTRGVGIDSSSRLCVVTPDDHVGLAAKSQPVLFWYLSKLPPGKPSLNIKIEFTINEEGSVNPLKEVNLGRIDKPGFYRINLSDIGISLQQGMEYDWSIAIVFDPEQRSKDIVATSSIKRVAINNDVKEKLATATKREAVKIYAEEGLWYDALAEIDDAIAANPNDDSILEARESLIKQVGLSWILPILSRGE